VFLTDGADRSSEISSAGIIEGEIAILVDQGGEAVLETEFGLHFQNYGTVRGRSGTAFQFGNGKDYYFGGEASRLIGIGDFGGGDDRLGFANDQFKHALITDPVQVFDGGSGHDTVVFGLDVTSLAIASVILDGPSDVSLEINGPNSTYTKRFLNFESFQFTDRTLTMADFGAVAAVPLPAPALMLGAALLGLGGFSRRTGGGAARRG